MNQIKQKPNKQKYNTLTELLRLKSMQQRLEGTRKQLSTSQKDLERDLLQSIDRLGLSKQEDALDSLVQTEEQRLRQVINRERKR